MRSILQRVSSAEVTVDGEVVGRVASGVLVLVGVEEGDGEEQVLRTAAKLSSLRLFADADGRMNLDAAAAGGGFLIVSQFTLAASLDRGRRPSFDHAAPPQVAESLIGDLVRELRDRGHEVECGRFGAHMRVRLVNDGPVTFVLDT